MSPVPPMPKVKTSGAAIASLVLGVLSLFCSLLTAIPAVVCGVVALVKINKSPGRISGQGMAIAGLVLGGLGMLIWYPRTRQRPFLPAKPSPATAAAAPSSSPTVIWRCVQILDMHACMHVC